MRGQLIHIETGNRGFDGAPAVIQYRVEPRGVGQSAVEHAFQDSDQQRGIRPRLHEMMRVRQLRGFGAARIDNDQLAVARLHFHHPFFKIGHGPDAAIGRRRVAADDQ